MKLWQLNPGYNARLALAGAMAGACALMASPAPAVAKYFLCKATGAATFEGKRIHVRCNPADGAIAYFALSVAKSDASRILSLAATAVVAKRTIGIFYDPNDLSGAAIGCNNNDCRLIQGVELF